MAKDACSHSTGHSWFDNGSFFPRSNSRSVVAAGVLRIVTSALSTSKLRYLGTHEAQGPVCLEAMGTASQGTSRKLIYLSVTSAHLS